MRYELDAIDMRVINIIDEKRPEDTWFIDNPNVNNISPNSLAWPNDNALRKEGFFLYPNKDVISIIKPGLIIIVRINNVIIRGM